MKFLEVASELNNALDDQLSKTWETYITPQELITKYWQPGPEVFNGNKKYEAMFALVVRRLLLQGIDVQGCNFRRGHGVDQAPAKGKRKA
jgi:hypothetical protein